MSYKTLNIDSSERIFLDGEELTKVTGYSLRHSAGEPAEFTVTMNVIVGQVASGPENANEQAFFAK